MNLFLFNLFTEIAISTKNMKIDCNPTQSNKLISALICTIFAQDAKIGYIRQSQASLLCPHLHYLCIEFSKGIAP